MTWSYEPALLLQHQGPSSVGHLHPLLIQIRPGPGRAPPDVDLVSRVDPHATTEPVHEQEIPVLMLVQISCFNPGGLIRVVKFSRALCQEMVAWVVPLPPVVLNLESSLRINLSHPNSSPAKDQMLGSIPFGAFVSPLDSGSKLQVTGLPASCHVRWGA